MHSAKKVLVFATFLAISVFAAWCAYAAPAKPKIDAVRAYALDCGHIHFQDARAFSDSGQYDGKPRDLADTCVLVGHPKGWLLWDTGLPKGLQEKPMEYFGARMWVDKTIQQQLAEIGLKPEDIQYVAFSHFHMDHAGNANDFPQATWLLQEKELAYGLSQPSPIGVDPSYFSGYKTAKKTMINGDYDVFGDGSVRFLSMPGHTAGHQVLLLKLPKQNYIFSGDLYHQRESFEHGYIPAFNYDRADTLASMDRMQKLLDNYHAKLIIQHDKGDFDSLPKLPAYLH